jgi:hypothetical protein
VIRERRNSAVTPMMFRRDAQELQLQSQGHFWAAATMQQLAGAHVSALRTGVTLAHHKRGQLFRTKHHTDVVDED